MEDAMTGNFRDRARISALAAAFLAAGMPVLAQQETLPPPRDPDIAVQEEFAIAEAGNTVTGWELFIARHPDHRLAVEARKRLKALRK